MVIQVGTPGIFVVFVCLFVFVFETGIFCIVPIVLELAQKIRPSLELTEICQLLPPED